MSEIKSDIERILDAGVRAPSGDNCQPWHFTVKNSTIFIYNLPERDYSLYSAAQRPSYIAHGALIENICIAANHFGYQTKLTLLPEGDKSDLTASIVLEKTFQKSQILFDSIFSRVTNRRAYEKYVFSNEEKSDILHCADDIATGRIRLIDDLQKKQTLSMVAATNEYLLFKNRALHNFFFDHVTWTEEEDKRKSMGFYIKTFEFKNPQEAAFRLFRNWGVVKVLNKIGIASFVAKENSKLYSTASGIGVVLVDKDTPQGFIEAGRVFQRAWLTSTQKSFSLQPLTGIVFLYHRVMDGLVDELSLRQIGCIKEKYNQIKEVFGLESHETIGMMFRVGKAQKPSARATRLPAVIDYSE